MTRRRRGWGCGHILASLALCVFGSACMAEGHIGEAANSIGTRSVGVVELALMNTDTVELFSITYSIVGPNFEDSGTVELLRSESVRMRLGDIPEGMGYLITLTGHDAADPELVCSGSATFDVDADQATSAAIAMSCRRDNPAGTGSLLLSGTINECPVLEAMTVTATHVEVGGSFTVSATAVDHDGLPEPLSYTWLSSGGELLDTADGTTELRCSQVGPVEVRVRASDGDCDDELAAWLNCTAAGTDLTGAAGAGGADGAGGTDPTPSADVRLNELVSAHGDPAGWVELVNLGTAAADLTNWRLYEVYGDHTYVLSKGTLIGPGERLVLEQQNNYAFSFGNSGEAMLFDATGALVDDFAYAREGSTSIGRCPDGTGDFVTTLSATKGTANACP